MNLGYVEMLNRLKQKQRMVKASLTRLEDYFSNLDSESVNINDVRLRVEKIEEAWKTLTEVQIEIAILDQELAKDRDRLARADSVDQAIGTAPHYFQRDDRICNNNFIRLLKIDLLIFSGEYEDWHAFIDIFNSLIYSSTVLSDVQRFHYLKSALKSEVAEIMSSLEISDANYADSLG